MFGSLARRLFGTVNDRIVKRMRPTVEAINALEPDLEKLTDEELKARTAWFKKRLEDGEIFARVLGQGIDGRSTGIARKRRKPPVDRAAMAPYGLRPAWGP